MRKRERVVVEIPKLNIVPVMDAVFILIFFLLLSAQFVNIYNIKSDAPAISDIDDEIKKKKPLNLIIKILPDEIAVTTGLTDKIVKRIKKLNNTYNFVELNKFLYQLKLENIKEQNAIIAPAPKIKYDIVIKAVDALRQLPPGESKVVKIGKKQYILNQIFENVIMEPN